MPNNIEGFKAYVTSRLDDVYKLNSLTSVLDGANDLAELNKTAKEIKIPKINMDGLADYDNGYVDGDVTFSTETKKCNFDRGRMFTVDTVENMDTAKVVFAKLTSEFLKIRVIPELDAFRFAIYAGTPGASVTESENIGYSSADALYRSIATKNDAMTDAEVPVDGRHLFITPTLYGMIRDMDTYKSKELINGFSTVKIVPQIRFYTAIDQHDGKTSGEEGGGYTRADHSQTFTATASQTDFVLADKPTAVQKVLSGNTSVAFTYSAETGTVTIAAQSAGTTVKVIYNSGANLNFMIIHKDAVIQYQKHVAPKIVTPEANQTADAWKYGYRNVGIAESYENKFAGIAGEYMKS